MDPESVLAAIGESVLAAIGVTAETFAAGEGIGELSDFLGVVETTEVDRFRPPTEDRLSELTSLTSTLLLARDEIGVTM